VLRAMWVGAWIARRRRSAGRTIRTQRSRGARGMRRRLWCTRRVSMFCLRRCSARLDSCGSPLSNAGLQAVGHLCQARGPGLKRLPFVAAGQKACVVWPEQQAPRHRAARLAEAPEREAASTLGSRGSGGGTRATGASHALQHAARVAQRRRGQRHGLPRTSLGAD
jgi:hypothetical protein